MHRWIVTTEAVAFNLSGSMLISTLGVHGVEGLHSILTSKNEVLQYFDSKQPAVEAKPTTAVEVYYRSRLQLQSKRSLLPKSSCSRSEAQYFDSKQPAVEGKPTTAVDFEAYYCSRSEAYYRSRSVDFDCSSSLRSQLQ